MRNGGPRRDQHLLPPNVHGAGELSTPVRIGNVEHPSHVVAAGSADRYLRSHNRRGVPSWQPHFVLRGGRDRGRRGVRSRPRARRRHLPAAAPTRRGNGVRGGKRAARPGRGARQRGQEWARTLATRRTLIMKTGTLLALGAAGFAALTQPMVLTAQRPAARARQAEVLPGPGTTWSLAAAGDAIITRRIAPFDNAADPRFQTMANVIRGADAAMVNL